MKYGVFSVSTPEYDLEETAKLVADLGYDGIEWRVSEVSDQGFNADQIALQSIADQYGVGDISQYGTDPEAIFQPNHPLYAFRYWVYNRSTLDVDNILEDARRAKEICDRYGLEIFGLTGYVGVDHLEKFENILKAAADINVPLVRVGLVNFDGEESGKTYPEAFEDFRQDLAQIADAAEKYGVKAVIEIHHGTLTPSPSAAMRALEGLNPDHIGVTFDPGNMNFEGYENYLNSLQLLGDYLAHVHLKNSALVPGQRNELGAVEYTQEWKPLKEGAADMKKLFQALKAVNYDKFVVVEDFTNEETTEEKLKEAMDYIKELEKATE